MLPRPASELPGRAKRQFAFVLMSGANAADRRNPRGQPQAIAGATRPSRAPIKRGRRQSRPMEWRRFGAAGRRKGRKSAIGGSTFSKSGKDNPRIANCASPFNADRPSPFKRALGPPGANPCPHPASATDGGSCVSSRAEPLTPRSVNPLRPPRLAKRHKLPLVFIPRRQPHAGEALQQRDPTDVIARLAVWTPIGVVTF